MLPTPYEACSRCSDETYRGPDRRLTIGNAVVCQSCMEAYLRTDAACFTFVADWLEKQPFPSGEGDFWKFGILGLMRAEAERLDPDLDVRV